MKELKVNVLNSYKDLHDEIKNLRGFLQTVHATNDEIQDEIKKLRSFMQTVHATNDEILGAMTRTTIEGDEIKNVLKLINHQIKSEFLR